MAALLCNLEAKDKTIDSLLITMKLLVLINILSFISSGNYLKLSNKNHDTWLKCMQITFIGSLLLWSPILIHVSIHKCLRDTHTLKKMDAVMRLDVSLPSPNTPLYLLIFIIKYCVVSHTVDHKTIKMSKYIT